MLLLVLFSIFLDIVQNARDWNEKLSRVFKYMNQWLVQVFVFWVGCVCFEATRFLLPRFPPLSSSNIRLTVPDVEKVVALYKEYVIIATCWFKLYTIPV